MNHSITDALQIKKNALQKVERDFEKLHNEKQHLMADISALERTLEIQRDLGKFEEVAETSKTLSNAEETMRRTKLVTKALKEKNGEELHVREVAEIIGVQKMTAKVWYSYQIEKKGSKCPWEFGKNKSWIRLKDSYKVFPLYENLSQTSL